MTPDAEGRPLLLGSPVLPSEQSEAVQITLVKTTIQQENHKWRLEILSSHKRVWLGLFFIQNSAPYG